MDCAEKQVKKNEKMTRLEKKRQMHKNVRVITNHMHKHCLHCSLSLYTHTHTHTNTQTHTNTHILHLALACSHTFSSPSSRSAFFSPSTHLCTEKKKNPNSSVLAWSHTNGKMHTHTHTHANTHMHTHTHTRAQKGTLMAEWTSRGESLSLQQLPVHSYHYNNSEWR